MRRAYLTGEAIMLQIHPAARESFNQRAVRLIDRLAEMSQNQPREQKPKFIPDVPIAGTIQESDIVGELEWGYVDVVGSEVGKFFEHSGKQMGLEGEAFQELSRLAEDIQRQKSFRDCVSESAVREHLFGWVREAYERRTDQDGCTYVEEKCGSRVREQEVWIPIAYLSIEEAFRVGAVELKPITKETYDLWCEKWLNQATNGVKEGRGSLLEKQRERYQGLTAGAFKLFADRERALQRAREETEIALAAVRMFSPANFHPGLCSYCQVFGCETVEEMNAVVLEDGGLKSFQSKMIFRGQPHWVVSKSEIEKIKNAGLESLSAIIASNRRTPYQQRVLDAVAVYSRVSISKEFSDKLTFLLVALESMLLRDHSEGIQDNLARRLAFLISRDFRERTAIIRTTKDVYELRSKFLHHAQRNEDVALLQSFMEYAWKAMFTFVRNKDRFQDHVGLITAIENAILKGGTRM
jgi:hypothetical protein